MTDERRELLDEAKELGLSFAANAKTDNIKKAIEQAKSEALEEDAFIEAGGEIDKPIAPSESSIRAQLEKEFEEKLEAEKLKLQAKMEVNLSNKGAEASKGMVSFGQARLKARKEATALKRVIVTCKDPAKQGWEGEIITVSNDVVGDVKKYVPYDLEEGYHIPQIILNMLKDREATVFITKKGKDGKNVQVAKIIKAHSIEILPDLTPEELSNLATEQKARHSID